MDRPGESSKPAEILLVEDNPADVKLIGILLKATKLHYRLTTVSDGEEATDYVLKRVKSGAVPAPDLIILDLNLPKKDGREVLREIKQSELSCGIPTLVLTTSRAEEDVRCCYQLHANCFITKPSDLSKFDTIVKSIEDFWFRTAELPKSWIVRPAEC